MPVPALIISFPSIGFSNTYYDVYYDTLLLIMFQNPPYCYAWSFGGFDKVHQFRIVLMYNFGMAEEARPGTKETPASSMAWKRGNWNRTFIIQIKISI